MSYDYDALYHDTPDALGTQTKAIAAAFARHIPPPARVLDLGCGQGRDALPLARAGYQVVGVDLSPHGVNAMLAAARDEQLDLRGHVADISTFSPDSTFDVLLFDRTLHMLDEEPRNEVLTRLLPSLRPGGFLLIEDLKSNLPGFRAVLARSGKDWKILTDKGGSLFARLGANQSAAAP